MIKDINQDKLDRQHEFSLQLRSYKVTTIKIIEDTCLQDFNLSEILEMLDEIYWSKWREVLKILTDADHGEYLNAISVFSMTRLNVFRKVVARYFGNIR